MSKRRYEGEQTKNDILAKAKKLFSQKGYAGTSMGDICKATGRSISNVYYYFKNKEDLFLCLTEENVAKWWEELDEIFPKCGSATEKLYAYSNFIARTERPPISVEREFINIVGIDSEAGQRLSRIISNSFERHKEFIAEGIASGEFKDHDLIELTFIVTSIYLGLNRYSSMMDQEARKTLLHRATTLLLQGMGGRNDK